jgi:flagellar basal-body rod modification protein FlgD
MTTTLPTSNVAAAIAPTIANSGATSGGSTTGANSAGTLSFTQNFNTFLTLLTTQLQNQDPLSPMDSNTFTQQLVAFSGVEQQIDTNNNLQNLIQLQTANETISATPLIGQNIEYGASTAPLENGQASFLYTLPSTAATTALVVENSNGNVVFSTTGGTSTGSHSFAWNGDNANGQQMPAGNYTLNVIATDANKNPITATVQSIGTVSSVSISSGQATFNINGISVPMSELIAVNPSLASSSGN